MGAKKKEIKRVVIDTNVLVSALLFKGKLSRIVDLWKNGTITPVISKETFDELKTVLGYPKFSLTKEEIKSVIEEHVLPFFEVIEVTAAVNGACRDPDDDKFIACALSAKAGIIVSGDKDLCDLGRYKTVHIMTAIKFVNIFYDDRIGKPRINGNRFI